MPPVIIAHRTSPRDAPENSLAGIRRSAELEADYVEIDVRLTRDGVPVMLHDALLLRCVENRLVRHREGVVTGARGDPPVDRLTLEPELRHHLVRARLRQAPGVAHQVERRARTLAGDLVRARRPRT